MWQNADQSRDWNWPMACRPADPPRSEFCRVPITLHWSVQLLLPAGRREAATAGISFAQRPKFSVLATLARLVASIHVKFGTPSGMSARTCKISPQSVHGGGYAAPKSWNFHFLVKIRPAGQTHSPIWHALVPKYFSIWRDSLHMLRNYCRKTVRLSFAPNFSVHTV